MSPKLLCGSLKIVGGGASDMAQGDFLRALTALVRAQGICFSQKALLRRKWQVLKTIKT
jgi:hypothetical protein